MPYIGNSPGTGTRNRFIYTATASQTTFSGADDNGKTLKYADSDYVDVYLNGICLVPVTDYTSTSKTSIVLTQAAALNDTLEVVAYDIATISDTVSKADGGNFEAGINVDGKLGIGTTDPDRSLHIVGNPGMIILEDSGGGTDDKRAALFADTGLFEISSKNDDDSTRLNDIFVADLGTGDIRMGDQGGTSTTRQKSFTISHQTGSSSEYGGLKFLRAHQNSEKIGASIVHERPGTSLDDSDLVFKTSSTNANATERMRIEHDGVISINSPDYSDFTVNIEGPDSGPATTGAAGSGVGALSIQNATNDVTLSAGVKANSDRFGWFQVTNRQSFAAYYAMAVQPNGGHFLIGCTDLPSSSVGGAGFEDASQDRSILKMSSSTTSNTNLALIYNPNGSVGSITTSGSSTAYNTSSDYRLKENVTDVTDGITRVKQLAPKRFNFIADADTTVDGFLAHEAQAVVPEAVTGTHNETEAIGNITDGEGNTVETGVVEPDTLEEGQTWTATGTQPVYQGIDQAKLVPLLTAALQEAIAKIETLETKVAALEAG